MDKQLTAKEQKQLLNALAKAKEMSRQLKVKEEEKRWSEIDVSLSLADGLGRLTKDELSTIRTSLGIKGASALKKQELIRVLEQQIPVELPELLNKMDETRYKILKQLADHGGHTFLSLESHQLDYFKNRGMIFSGTHNGKKTLVMPQEVLECLKKTNTASYRETIRRNTEWIKLTYGMLYYYGTLSLKELEYLMKQHTEMNLAIGDYLFILDESVSFYREIRLDKSGFSNIRVWDAERVKKEHLSRPGLPFYPFTKTELLIAGEPGFVDRYPSYQAFVEFIRKNYTISRDAADSLVEECVYAIRIGEPPSNLLQFLQSQMEIDELEMLQAFMDHIVQLNNNTKQWFIKGYTPNELSPNKERQSHSLSPAKAEVVDIVTRKKVGRNDPCPCGSGKKFKKCCGG